MTTTSPNSEALALPELIAGLQDMTNRMRDGWSPAEPSRTLLREAIRLLSGHQQANPALPDDVLTDAISSVSNNPAAFDLAYARRTIALDRAQRPQAGVEAVREPPAGVAGGEELKRLARAFAGAFHNNTGFEPSESLEYRCWDEFCAAVDGLPPKVAAQPYGFQARYRKPEGEWSSWASVLKPAYDWDMEIRVVSAPAPKSTETCPRCGRDLLHMPDEGNYCCCRRATPTQAAAVGASSAPVAWIVYLPSMQTQEIFDSQDDAGYVDWLTNYPDAVVTPLYASSAPVVEPAADINREMLAMLRVTRGNVASLGPAGALANVPVYAEYRIWLQLLDDLISKVTGEHDE